MPAPSRGVPQALGEPQGRATFSRGQTETAGWIPARRVISEEIPVIDALGLASAIDRHRLFLGSEWTFLRVADHRPKLGAGTSNDSALYNQMP